ncbi:uroporphyrinogen-III synthase [Fastidiosibacter lacustris]|uniref:uroporphyrinogen-III synthase n=1 Tax=Fastidiosibacter lacustris TaxID=2056695 RepID=UPI000E345A05|nr:uroporphyrinogen-III synthase [Fastidiosibacter lacustris]
MSMQQPPKVIVCRPEPKATELVEQLNKCDISAVVIEPFIINYLPFELNAIDRVTDMIFTSTFAVEAFFHQMVPIDMLDDKKIWAIGEATKAKLKAFGLSAIAPQHADSEGLLEVMDYSADVLSKGHFLIVKGEGGREYLAYALANKVKKLTMVDCYRRVFVSKHDLVQQLQSIDSQTAPCVILYTSFDAMQATMAMFDLYPSWRNESIVTVTNTRMLSWAKCQGFVKLYLLEKLSNDALINTLMTLLKKGMVRW